MIALQVSSLPKYMGILCVCLLEQQCSYTAGATKVVHIHTFIVCRGCGGIVPVTPSFSTRWR